MRVVSHPEADQELEEAATWYEDRQSGLGDALLDDFERTLRRIVAEPDRWHKILGDKPEVKFPPLSVRHCVHHAWRHSLY